jgi:hypothetical protein
MLLNLGVLCRIFSVALLLSKQEEHFATASIALMRLLRTSITLFFNTVVLFRYNFNLYTSLINVLVAFSSGVISFYKEVMVR